MKPMPKHKMFETRPLVTALLPILLLAACGGGEPEPSSVPASDAVLYEGFTLITGNESDPIDDAAFLIDDGIIQAVGATGELGLPAGASRVDLSGKTVMPAIVSLHGHPGFQVGLTFEAEHYTRDTLIGPPGEVRLLRGGHDRLAGRRRWRPDLRDQGGSSGRVDRRRAGG